MNNQIIMIMISKSVIEKDGKFLITRRAASRKAFPEFWDFPGGKFDPGEDATQTVVREVMEEVALEIEPGEMLKTAEYHDDQYDLLFHYFEPIIISGEIKLSHEHTEFKWVTQDEIKELKLAPSITSFFK